MRAGDGINTVHKTLFLGVRASANHTAQVRGWKEESSRIVDAYNACPSVAQGRKPRLKWRRPQTQGDRHRPCRGSEDQRKMSRCTQEWKGEASGPSVGLEFLKNAEEREREVAHLISGARTSTAAQVSGGRYRRMFRQSAGRKLRQNRLALSVTNSMVGSQVNRSGASISSPGWAVACTGNSSRSKEGTERLQTFGETTACVSKAASRQGQ